MPLLRAVVEHAHANGLPEDRTQNTWHFGTQPGGSTTLDRIQIRDALQAFYSDQVTGVGGPIDAFLAGTISRTVGRTIRFYEKDTGEKNFGSPIEVETGLPIDAAGTATNLPGEVACVLSYHGDLTDVPEEAGNTRPAAQRRGHIYIGPFNLGANEGSGTARSRPSPTLFNVIAGAAGRLLDTSQGAISWTWMVAHAADTAAWTVTQVVGGWSDDAWDTQRRRGEDASTRVLFS